MLKGLKTKRSPLEGPPKSAVWYVNVVLFLCLCLSTTHSQVCLAVGTILWYVATIQMPHVRLYWVMTSSADTRSHRVQRNHVFLNTSSNEDGGYDIFYCMTNTVWVKCILLRNANEEKIPYLLAVPLEKCSESHKSFFPVIWLILHFVVGYNVDTTVNWTLW